MSTKLSSALIALPLLFITTISAAQNISGNIADTAAKKNIGNAVVALLSLPDTVLYKFTRTGNDGSFNLHGIGPGRYILLVTHPYFADYQDKLDIGNGDTRLDKIALTNKSKLLQEVIVRSGAAMKIKGDTTVFIADSFKTSANANVEELLKKLPGITVDKSGTITAMGETVSTVLVDGEEFFGDDPGMAVKNIRADAVKEVQVFDKKSDQATFTGVDDGKTDKAINLKLKDDRKKGYFGKIDLAGGLLNNREDRYNNNLMLSSFKGNRKISGYFLNGNTGQNGLSWQDNDKYGGGNSDNWSIDMDESSGMLFASFSGNTDDEPNVDTDNGFMRNINAGVQYTNKWNDKHTLNFSPKYNDQVYTNTQNSFVKTVLGDSVLNYNGITRSDVERYNIKSTLKYEVKIDSNNSFKITNRVNYYNTLSEEVKASDTKGEWGTMKNTSNVQTKLSSEKTAVSGSLIFRHRFRKDRRTLSLSSSWGLIHSDANTFLSSLNETYSEGSVVSLVTDQNKKGSKGSQTITAKLSYTEPLSKKYTLEIANEVSVNNGKNNQQVYAYSTATNKYDDIVDSLTNDFKQSILTVQPSARLSYNKKKMRISVGSGIGVTHFDLTDITYGKDYIRNYVNYYPSAHLDCEYKSNKHFRIDYSGSTTQPTINQLQPLRNNDDYFNQYLGNPDLKPSFLHRVNFMNNSYNFIKDRWTFFSLNLTTTQNAITNTRIVNTTTGKTTIQPVNTNGNYSVGLWSGVGFKFKKADMRLNMNPSFSFNRMKEIINGINNYTKTLSAGMGFGLSKSKEKSYDCWLNDNFMYNSNKNTVGTSSDNYITNSMYLDATVFYKKVWSFNTRYENHYRQKTITTQQGLNTNILNAKIQRTFRSDEFTAYISGVDLLNQNRGIDMSFYGNSYSVTTNTRLQRYWMLGFIWNFKNKADKKPGNASAPPPPPPAKP